MDCLPSINLGHSSDAPASQSRILVAVSPTINRALDQATLSTQRHVQFGQRPANGIALGFVDQSVAFVTVLVAASSRIDAVIGLELLAEVVDVD